MRMIATLFYVLLALNASVLAADYDNSQTIGPSKGSLIINGGGGVAPDVVKRFVELAGGADAQYVLIPTAVRDENIDCDNEARLFRRQFGIKNVTILHTRKRKLANSAEFIAPLQKASGVWIVGGRQWRLADAYLGTRVEEEIKALVARGGVVGGGSAGATIQGSFLVRGSPSGYDVMISPGHEKGFALLPDSAIDQHIDARGRLNDLDYVIRKHPKLLGIGLDEKTAIWVHGDSFEVMGAGKVVIHDGKDHNGKPYYFLSPGQIFNLRSRTAQ